MTATAPHRAATRARRPRLAIASIAGLVLAAAFFFGVLPRLSLPATIDITLENPHEWRANVDVTGAERDGWQSLGVLAPRSTRPVQAVVDQGDMWTFQFAYAGVSVELTVSRDALETAAWTVRVPDEFGAELAQKDVPPTPG